MGLGGLMVAAGGALGAAGRYGISLLPWRGSSPCSPCVLTSWGLWPSALSSDWPGRAAFPRLDSVLEDWGVRRLYHLLYFFSGELHPAGAGKVASVRGIYVSKRGAVPAGSGPGAEVERGCLNRPCMSGTKGRRLPPPFYFSIFFDMPPNLSWKICQDWAFLNARIKRSWKAREKTGKD